MNMKLIGAVPVKPHLLKFVQRIENLQPGEPLDLTRNSTICYTLSLFFSNKTNANLSAPFTKDKGLTGTLRFKISSDMQAFNRFFMTPKAVNMFNRWLHNYFHDFLLNEILQEVRFGKMTERDVIYRFMDRYDIDEIIDFHTLKKASYRLRLKKKIGTIHQESCPVG